MIEFNQTFEPLSLKQLSIVAYESYINYSDLLGDPSNESFLGIDWEKIKRTFKEFLHKMWNTIRNFIGQFFVQKEVMLNEKVMKNLSAYTDKWGSSIKTALAEYETGVVTGEDASEFIDNIEKVTNDIKDECQKQVLDRNQAIMSGYHASGDYRIFKKNDINILNHWAATLEKSANFIMSSCDDILRKSGENPELIKARANNILVMIADVLTFVNTAISKTMIDAQFSNRKTAGSEDFGKEVPVTITI